MKNLNIIVKDIASLLNLATSKSESIEKGFTHYIELEYNSNYGGYRLNSVNNQHGGHSGVFGESASCPRRSLKVMEAYLNGLYNGIKATKV